MSDIYIKSLKTMIENGDRNIDKQAKLIRTAGILILRY